ncbi:MAG: right-handed parallel beta-helix repeat-containing protein, partial [Phycisphaerales bacterium JB039]
MWGALRSLTALVAAAAAVSANGQTLYVDDDALFGGTGTSWDEAFPYLQDALAAARLDPAVQEIRIAGGIYSPDWDSAGAITPGDQFARFQIETTGAGLSMRGGYRGLAGGGDPDDRDPALFETELSGDLLRNDQPGFVRYDENSFRVVEIASQLAAIELDGLTIRSGNATFPGPDNGAGVAIIASDVRVRDCAIRLNRADGGSGGVYIGGSAVHLTGGVFATNLSMDDAGGLEVFGSDVTIDGVDFISNTAVHLGGAAQLEGGSNVTVDRCRFVGNVSSADNGGAVVIKNAATVVTVANCLFDRNRAGAGGALFLNQQNSPLIVNCTFVRNEASIGGGAISTDRSTATIANCVLWENAPDQIWIALTPAPSVSYSCIQGGFGGVGVIDADPLFVDPAADDFRLAAYSACIDAGDRTRISPLFDPDLLGAPRFVDDPWRPDTGTGPAPAVDLGAFEHQAPQCLADFNRDGLLDVFDFLEFQNAFA